MHKDGETVVVELDKQVLLRLPIHTLNGIVTFGNVMVGPYLLNFCAERGVCATMIVRDLGTIGFSGIDAGVRKVRGRGCLPTVLSM